MFVVEAIHDGIVHFWTGEIPAKDERTDGGIENVISSKFGTRELQDAFTIPDEDSARKVCLILNENEAGFSWHPVEGEMVSVSNPVALAQEGK